MCPFATQGHALTPLASCPGAPPRPGSLHKDRVIFDKATRDLLSPLFRPGQSGGMDAAHHAQAVERLEGHCVAPYLVGADKHAVQRISTLRP